MRWLRSFIQPYENLIFCNIDPTFIQICHFVRVERHSVEIQRSAILDAAFFVELIGNIFTNLSNGLCWSCAVIVFYSRPTLKDGAFRLICAWVKNILINMRNLTLVDHH